MLKTIEELLDFKEVKNILSGYAETLGGKNYCQNLHWFTDQERIILLLDELDEIITLINNIPDISLSGLKENHDILKKIVPENSFLKPEEILNIYINLQLSRSIKKRISKVINDLPNIKEYYLRIVNLKDLESKIERVIDIKNVMVKDSASPELSKIRKTLNDIQRKVKREIEKIVGDDNLQKMLMDNYFTIKDNRFVIPLRIEYKNKIKGIIHGFSSSKQTVYIEPEKIVELDNRIVELKNNEKVEIQKVLTLLSDKIREHIDDIRNNYKTLIYFDFLLAKGRYSIKRKLTRPRLSNNILKIIDGRHPLLIEQPEKAVIPVSIKNTEDARILVITGPNTGGKTITLKMIGLIQILFQAGMFVPAEIGTQLPIFRKIFADIGDEQSIEQSLSTFSGHLEVIKNTLNKCKKDSLVLLDELGAGTDPSEGGALGCGILTFLEKKKSTVFTTTHLNSIKIFAHNSENCMNASMEFDLRTLRPTFRIILGIPGSSYALSIAERLRLPPEVISSAKGFLSDSSLKLDKLLRDIQNSSILIEEDRRLTKLEKVKAFEIKDKYEKRLEELLLKEREIYEETIKKSEKLLNQFRKDFEKIVKQVKEGNASKEVIKEAKKTIETRSKALKQEKKTFESERITKPQIKIKDLKEGVWVKIQGFSDWAKIVELNFEKDILKCQIGNINIQEKFKNILELRETLPEGTVTEIKVSNKREFKSLTLEVFGLIVEDAISEIDIFINDAFLNNVREVYITHGIGSGRLKRGVLEFLSENSLVKSYRDSAYSSGGPGTTVVILDK